MLFHPHDAPKPMIGHREAGGFWHCTYPRFFYRGSTNDHREPFPKHLGTLVCGASPPTPPLLTYPWQRKETMV